MSAAPSTSTATAVLPFRALEMFRSRCEARAHLYAAGEIPDLHDAIDVLQEHAVKHGLVRQIGQDAVQTVMAEAFQQVRAWELPP